MGPSRQSPQGSVTLVALCMVAVLGISLASYIAVCSRAMSLSNRSFQTGLSQQLAEAGLEEALRAFNKNDWSDWSNGTAANWTLDTTNHRATCNLTFPASKFSQGVTGSVKIRVDNYDATQLSATWSSTANYRINDLVGVSGVWYRCVQNGNLNKNPATQTDLAWWVPTPIPWAWSSNTSFTINSDVVCNGGTWYRCSTSHTSGSSFAAGNWTSIPAPSLAWNSSVTYTAGAFVFSGGTWYRCKFSNINSLPPNGNWETTSPYISWGWRNGINYEFNDLVFYSTSGSGTWYRCITPHTSSAAATPAGANWENALSASWAWASTYAYNLNDVVYSGGSFYRCIFAHTNHAPPNATYWSNAPLYSTAWDSGRQYSQNDTVRYEGVWYLSLQNSNIGQNPATATTYWIGANTANASYTWNSASAYTVGNYRCYGGVWYNCIAAHTGKSPGDTTYWTATWANSSGVSLGAPVVFAEGTVNIAGSPSTRTQLRATIAQAPLFPNAAAATTTITANSGGTVDSYDSNVGTYASQVGTSTNYSAVVAASSTSGTAVTLSSTAVKGYLAAPSASSSPYAPLYSSGGSVKGASSPGSPNIDLAHVSRSPYIPVFDTQPGGAGGLAANWATVPKGTALALSTTINIGTAGVTTPSRYYYNGNLTIGTGTVNYLRINGPVILYVNGDLFITASGSTGRIDLTSAGSAEIHLTGAFKADVGGEGIQNYTTDPKSLIIICDTTSTASHFYSEGVNPLYGVIYVPYSTSNTGYFNDNTGTNIYGAVSANKITYSGANLNIHYDTALRNTAFGGVDQPYAITEWRELTAPIDKATMP